MTKKKALQFYMKVLGFVKKSDIPMGKFRWLTVVSPNGPDDLELVLEPTAFPPAKTYQAALFKAGIASTAFAVDDIQQEYKRLRGEGVVFRSKPTKAGDVIQSVFEDTCGNLIQLYQQ